MKRIIRLTESDLARIVKKVISERNVLSEEYLLVSVPQNYDSSNKNGKKWMNGLIGLVEPTSVKTADGRNEVQQGFYDDASKNCSRMTWRAKRDGSLMELTPQIVDLSHFVDLIDLRSQSLIFFGIRASFAAS